MHTGQYTNPCLNFWAFWVTQILNGNHGKQIQQERKKRKTKRFFLNFCMERYFSQISLRKMYRTILQWVEMKQSSPLNSKLEGLLYKLQVNVLRLFILYTTMWISLFSSYELFKPLVTSMKASSVHGIVRPPIGWLNPNSSSAWLNKFWNEGFFKYEIGTTNLFFWASPT